jgi:PII-like signaling protein
MIEVANIRIFTSERARHGGKPVANAVVHLLHGLKIGARCTVTRGHEALYENGEISTDSITDLSYNLPIVVDILVPEVHLDAVLSALKGVVDDGVIGVLPLTIVHRPGHA